MMDLKQREEAVLALRKAAQRLMARGPTNPQAVFRYGSKPNQAPVMRSMRAFLEAYAAAGNKLMQGEDPDMDGLLRLAAEIQAGMDELIKSVEELS